MVKVLYGALAGIVIGVAGFFGFQFYTQYRVASEVEAVFDQIRATGAKASHGKVSFDLKSRTLTVSDIVGESAAQPPMSLKIASITASGVNQPDATRLTADSIEATGIEVGAAMAAPSMAVTYKVPQITVKDYSGPASLQQPPASSSLLDVRLFALKQLANITAASITAPSVVATINIAEATPVGGDVIYSGIAVENIKDGKIATAKVDGFVFTINMQPVGKPEKLTGNLANLVTRDIDINAMAAPFDPQKANDDQYYRAYRQISAGPYIITSAQGLNMRIDSLTMDDVGLRPSRLQLPALLAMMPPAGAAAPTPAQARELIEKVATIYQGIRIGNAEMHGLSVETPQGPLKLSAMRFNFDNGKIGELAFEGLDARAPNGPIKLGSFVLKALDISGLLRTTAQFAGQQPSPDQALLALLPLIEGAEMKGLVAPYKNTGKPITIDTISLNWGQFIGPIPSQAHVAAKLTVPIDPTNPALLPLVAAGMDSTAIDLDLGAAWREASRTFAIAPVTLEVGSLLKASARVSFANVPREAFSINPVQAANMAAQIEAGTIELTLHDLGGVDLAVAQYAGAQSVTRDEARRAIIDSIRSGSEKSLGANPSAAAAVDALIRFIETPGQTLIVKLRPLGKVPVLQLMQLLKTDPSIALAKFLIEASTGL
jgi:hypothetical protein